MPLKRKHLEAISLANIPYTTEVLPYMSDKEPNFISVEQDHIVEFIELVHQIYPEDKPVIPIKLDNYNKYILYVRDE